MPVVSTIVNLPKTPDAQRIPEEWNKQWETLLSQGSGGVPLNLESILKKEVDSGARMTIAALASAYSALLRSTLELRFAVSGRYVLFGGDPFEAGWRKASVDTRRKHALFALSDSCAVARNLNEARLFTEDILTLKNLTEKGETVIELIRDMLCDISGLPSELAHFPHAKWDAFREEKMRSNPAERVKLALEDIRLLRTKLIYYVLQNIYMSFMGKLDQLPQIMVARNHKAAAAGPTEADAAAAQKAFQKKAMQATMGKTATAQLSREDRQAWRDRKDKRRNGCSRVGCGVHEEEGQKFSRCSACFEKGERTISYCSRECQVRDWKEGHKRECGKLYDTLQSATAAASSSDKHAARGQIPPAAPGFRRSPALLHHIYMLSNNPDADTFLKVRAGPMQDDTCYMKIDTPYAPIQNLVRAARDRAMVSGDRESAAQFCQYTLWFVMAKHIGESHGWSYDEIIAEWAREFEFPTLKEEMIKLQEAQLRDPLRRPPLVASLEPAEWSGYINMAPVDFEVRIPTGNL